MDRAGLEPAVFGSSEILRSRRLYQARLPARLLRQPSRILTVAWWARAEFQTTPLEPPTSRSQPVISASPLRRTDALTILGHWPTAVVRSWPGFNFNRGLCHLQRKRQELRPQWRRRRRNDLLHRYSLDPHRVVQVRLCNGTHRTHDGGQDTGEKR